MKRRRWADPPPEYLEASAEVRVRFQEVDGLHIVWHGHYATYLEEGRQAFGRQYGLGYQDVRARGFAIPLVHMELDYLAPATYDQLLTVRARLHPEPAARLTFSYEVSGPDGGRLASALTVQAFTDLTSGELALTRPAFYEAWLERWKGELRSDP